FYSEQEIIDSLIKRGFSAIDMETAILYILGWMRGWKTLSILVISNNLLRKTPLKTTMELKEKFILLTQYILDIL
ncbi:MAG: purine-nucleoside phosphorylase, partial [Staphylothermus sp.]|nr:purine-nucleoside phosphorylase [Staphylothermus sp.]